MANVYVGGKRKKRGKIWIILIIVIAALVAIFGIMFYNYNQIVNSPIVTANKLTYTVSYDNSLYFIRVLNDSRKVMIVKIEEGTTFPGTYYTLNSNILEKTSNDFLDLFELKSDANFYFYLNNSVAHELSSQLNGISSEGIDGLIDSLKNSEVTIWNFFRLSSYLEIIKNYDRSTNLNEDALYALINGFSKFSITNYDKLTVPLMTKQPLQINIGPQTVERKYADLEVLERMKQVVE